MSIDLAADAFLADCARTGWAPRSIAFYRSTFRRFGEQMQGRELEEIGADDLRAFLAAHPRLDSHLASLFRWLLREGRIATDPMATLPRRRQRRAEDLEVVSVSSDEVRRLLDAAESWPERLALGILAYLGPRRHAVALLRLADWDQLHGQIRFREKGGKVIWKPCPAELQDLLRQALRAGVWADCYCPPGDRALGETADGAGLKGNSPAASPYLVPPEGRLRRAERDDRIIWRLVKRVAARAGIAQCTTHALRAAFACFYDEANPGDTLALRDLMGHASVQTTELYLRRRDKQRGMERVRDLSWRRAS